jgi:hypothetical protein
MTGECWREYMDLAEFESRFRIVSTAARKTLVNSCRQW